MKRKHDGELNRQEWRLALNGLNRCRNKLDNGRQTGETSNLVLGIGLLFISGGVAIGKTVVSRKKKYNR